MHAQALCVAASMYCTGLVAGEDTEYSSSSDEEESDEGDNTERSDDSMHTSDFETSHDSQDGSSDGEAVQQL